MDKIPTICKTCGGDFMAEVKRARTCPQCKRATQRKAQAQYHKRVMKPMLADAVATRRAQTPAINQEPTEEMRRADRAQLAFEAGERRREDERQWWGLTDPRNRMYLRGAMFG